MTTEPSDGALVAAIRAGDRSALIELDQRWRPRLVGLARSILHDEHLAEEVAQVALWRTYLNLDRYDNRRPFERWILKIARNTALDLQRRRPAARTTDDGELLRRATNGSPSSADQVATEEELRALNACIDSLGDQSRTVVALHDIIGLSLGEIGKLVGRHKNTVQYWRGKAFKELQRCMAEKGFGENPSPA